MSATGMRRRILVVDDTRLIRRIVSDTLAGVGEYDVEAAASGEEALARLEKSDYDLVILDVEMPGLNGFDVVRSVREREGNKHRIAVIALTGGTAESGGLSAEDERRCREAGMDDCLPKPFERQNLLSAVERLLVPPPPLERK